MPSATAKGVPYPLGTDAAALLDTIVQSLAEWVDNQPGISSLTTAQITALSGSQRWLGRVVYNNQTLRLLTWNGASWAGVNNVDDNTVSNAGLRDSAALSVIGRSANSAGDPADIAAGTDGHVLRRSGTTLGFGTIATAGIADDAVTQAKMAPDSVGSAELLANSVGTAELEDDAVTQPKIANTEAGGTIGSIRYVKILGWVFVEGFISGFAGGTLPVGYRPTTTVHVAGGYAALANAQTVRIATTGVIDIPWGSANIYFSAAFLAA